MDTCTTCGEPGYKDLGTRTYCLQHLDALYSTFTAPFAGYGTQDGPMRPDWGEHHAELRCVRCDATWIGPLYDGCAYCVIAHASFLTYSVEMVLRRPDVDPSAAHYAKAMYAWADRLAAATRAGLLTVEQADRAWRRACAEKAA